MRTAAGIVALLMAAAAQAAPSYSGKLSLTGLYYDEAQSDSSRQLASTGRLLYSDVRLIFAAQRLAERLDLRFDGRIRVTGGFDFENKFTAGASPDPFNNEFSARGYLGGREYDLREAYALVRLSDRSSLQVGRMFILEADVMKADAVRVLQRFGDHWQGSLFGGGYPNPYSRSVLTDYTPPCGYDVASGSANLADLQPPDPNRPPPAKLPVPASLQQAMVAPDPCQARPQLALAGGLTAAYQYRSLWGSIGAVGSYFGGVGDGGPIRIDPSKQGLIGNLLPGTTGRDAPRIFVSWMSFVQPVAWLDLFSDLVVDLYGSAGPQPTRIALQGTGRFLRGGRMVVRLGYTHLSSLAINMYLSELLYNRAPNGSTLNGGSLGVVENSLTVLRTGRDEARGSLDIRLVRRLGLGLDGRFRYRSLIGGDSNPTVFNTPLFTDNMKSVAGDATVSLRDRGSLAGMRALLSYTFLSDYRALDHVVKGALGRDLFKQRLGVDLEYVFVLVRDAGAGLDNQACAPSTPSPTTAAYNPFLPGCFGRRSGATHEAGAAVTVIPSQRLFLLVDYRFRVMLTDSQPRYQPQVPNEIPTVISHSLLLRADYHW
jgi:hypothetical protein